MAVRDELALDLEIVFDDAVVDDDDAPGTVAMRMRVFLGGTAVSGPARVAQAGTRQQSGFPSDRVFKVVGLGAARISIAPSCTTATPAESSSAISRRRRPSSDHRDDRFRDAATMPHIDSCSGQWPVASSLLALRGLALRDPARPCFPVEPRRLPAPPQAHP